MQQLKKFNSNYNPRCEPIELNEESDTQDEPIEIAQVKTTKKPAKKTTVGLPSFAKGFHMTLKDNKNLTNDYHRKNKIETNFVLMRRTFHEDDKDLHNCYFTENNRQIKTYKGKDINGYFIEYREHLKDLTEYDVHEVILADQPRRLFFDIDLETEKAETLMENEEVREWLGETFETMSEFVDLLRGKFIRTVQDCVYALHGECVLPPMVAQIDTFNRNRAEKYSYHLIVSNYKVANCFQQKYFNRYLKESLSIPMILFENGTFDLLDKPNQCFAMPFAKSKGYRLVGNDTNAEENDPAKFMVTLDTIKCHTMPFINSIDPTKSTTYINEPITDANAKEAFEKFKESLPEVAKSYAFDSVKNAFAYLRRIAPVNCPVCKRTHEGNTGDRAYLTRTERVTNITDYRFGCLRKKDSPKTVVFGAAFNFITFDINDETEEDDIKKDDTADENDNASTTCSESDSSRLNTARLNLEKAKCEVKAIEKKTKLQQKKEKQEEKHSEKDKLNEKKKQLEKKWIEWDEKNAVDFTKDPYTWSDFDKTLRKTMFASEFEAEKCIAEYSRKCIVAVNGGFYVKHDDTEHIYDYVPRNKIGLDLIAVGFYGSGQRNPKLSDYVHLFRTCSIIHSSPSQTQKYNVLNTWGKVQAVSQDTPDITKVQPWLDFIKNIWACGNEQVYKWLLKWFKITCTMSEEKTNKAIFVFGKRGGEGKTMLTNFIKMILGKKMSVEMNGLTQLLEKHETAVEGRKFVVVNEISEGRDEMKNHFNQLKTYITDKELHINPKNQAPRDVENFANFILISNHEDAIHIHPRRYMVIEISPYYALPENIASARKFYKENVNQDAANNFYSYLMSVDLDDVEIEDIPTTDARIRAIERSRSNLEAFITEKQEEFNESTETFANGRVNPKIKPDEKEDKAFWVPASYLHGLYSNWCETNKVKNILGVRAFQAKLDSVLPTQKIDRVLCYNIMIFTQKTPIQPAQ